jgi:hypothetical protein
MVRALQQHHGKSERLLVALPEVVRQEGVEERPLHVQVQRQQQRLPMPRLVHHQLPTLVRAPKYRNIESCFRGLLELSPTRCSMTQATTAAQSRGCLCKVINQVE